MGRLGDGETRGKRPKARSQEGFTKGAKETRSQSKYLTPTRWAPNQPA
ncbi:MAG: hypothetical protein K9J30_07650 [Bacteroidales bacterium]|nr:hypothetical protein [Bacteroidales bacterium]